MARTFDGSDDVIHCSIGALTGRTAAGTFAGIVRRTNDTAFHSIVGLHNSAGTNTLYFQINPTDQLVLGSSGGEATSTLTVLTATSWVLVAVTKASGSATPRFHRLTYSSNAWTHEAGSGAITDGGSPGAGGTFRTAWQTGDFFQGDIAAVGIWSSALSDSQVEALGYSLAHWHAVSPQAMWVFDQSATTQSVGDLTGGGANQSSLTGTAVASTSVPVLGYGASVTAVGAVPSETPVSLADTGTADDALTVAAAAGLTDTCSADDDLTTTAAVPLADTATGADEIAISRPAAVTDDGSAADELTVAAAAAVSDTAAGADQLTVDAAVPLADICSAADALSVQVAAPLADEATGTEALTVAAQAALSDAGTGAEALEVAAAVGLSDAASGADELATGIPVALTDLVTAADELSVTVLAGLADTCSAAESLGVAADLAVSDAASADDALFLPQTVTLTEECTAVDALFVVGAASRGSMGARQRGGPNTAATARVSADTGDVVRGGPTLTGRPRDAASMVGGG